MDLDPNADDSGSDNDGDQQTNGAEFRALTNPSDASSFFCALVALHARFTPANSELRFHGEASTAATASSAPKHDGGRLGERRRGDRTARSQWRGRQPRSRRPFPGSASPWRVIQLP
ncbi:MAG: hypothetical protein R3F11_23065 [Verrucomicrobiales bacterium]